LKRSNSAKKIQALTRGRQTRKSSPLDRKRLEKNVKLNLNNLNNNNNNNNNSRSHRNSNSYRSNNSSNQSNRLSSRRSNRSHRSNASKNDSEGHKYVINSNRSVTTPNSGRNSGRSSGRRSTMNSNSARSQMSGRLSGRLSGRNSARGNNSARGEGGPLRSKSQMQSRLQRIDSVSLLNKNSNLLEKQIKYEVPDHLRTDGYVKKKSISN
jgi:hypothetical protein